MFKRKLLQQLLPAILVLVQLSGCQAQHRKEEAPGRFRVEEAFPNLHFDYPVDLTHANDATDRLFVLEQAGVIKVFKNTDTATVANVFLDIRNKVSYGGEAGLLGLAFHPDFKRNGYFFLNYTTKAAGRLQTFIVRYQVSASNPNQANRDSEKLLLSFDQPWDNHNGGAIKFGPDGYLYIATGDGGSWGDPHNNAQNKKVLLGKILRIDVNNKGEKTYSIPRDNPFAGNLEGFREEVYAYGLRNPWRISFDSRTNTLWAGDVGQNRQEEIDIIVKRGNYGWPRKEGIDCYKPSTNCNDPSFIDPVLDMPQANGERSVTGGFVYRGKRLSVLAGKYIFGDYVSGRIFALETKAGKAIKNSLLVDKAGQISSFGVDSNDELYVCMHLTGKIMRLASQ